MLGIAPDSNVPAKVGVSGISLRDIVFMLFRRRWVVLAVSVPIIVIGGTSLFRQTGSYTAACRVLVELMNVDLPRWNTTGRNIDFDRELSTMFNIAMSLPVVDMAAASLQDSIPVLMEMMPQATELDQPGALRGLLMGRLDVSPVGESNILEFRFSSAHPRLSLMAVGAMRDAFVEYQVHSRKNVRAMTYYTEQVQTVQVQIDSLLSVRKGVLVEAGYSSLEDEMANQASQISGIETLLLNATAQRRAEELKYETLKSYLDGDPLDFPFGLGGASNSVLDYWRNMVSKHQDDLNSLLSVHTEESTPVRRQRVILEKALERLHQEEVAFVEGIRLQLLSTKDQEKTLTGQIETLKQSSSRAPGVEARISLIDIEMESLRSLLKDMQGKLGEVRLNQMADERVSSVTPLTEPEMLMSLSGGKTMVYFAMIAVFALALGIVLAIILETMDHRVYHPKDIEDNLKLPVFASVTRTD